MRMLLLVLATVFTLISCATVPMGDPAQDSAFKEFQAPQNKAGIYIYRNESIGSAVKMEVAIDGVAIGRTVAKTYFYKVVTPGRHTVTSKAENIDAIELDLKPRTLTYIWQEVKMGILYARTKLHIMDEAKGRKGVLETDLAKTQ